jgi:hypothetical protein
VSSSSGAGWASYFTVTSRDGSVLLSSKQETQLRRLIMKTLATALVALSVLAGVAAPASAASNFSIQQLDREGRGGHFN